MKKLILLFVASILFLAFGNQFNISAQDKLTNQKTFVASKTLRGSGAYADILLKRANLESKYAEMIEFYTDKYPGVKETQYELKAINRELAKLNQTPPEDGAKLTSALGKLIVRMVELETDYWAKSQRYGDEHPDVRRAKLQYESFKHAIDDIL